MIRLFSIFILLLPFSIASYCGKFGVPYSFEVLSSGAPVLGCAQPSCVIQPEDFEEDSEFLTDAKGQVDGYFREGDRDIKRYRHDTAPKFVANCSGGFEHLACKDKNQWVGGIEYIDHPRQPLVLQCCSYDGLKFSQEVGMTTISAGEAITGGEVVRAGRQISFDVIANVKKIVNSGKINYEVTVRRMNCLPDPPEPEIPFDDDVPSEIAKVLGTAKNGKDLGTAEKFEKKKKLTDKHKKSKKHKKVTTTQAPVQPPQPSTQPPTPPPPPQPQPQETVPPVVEIATTEKPAPVPRQLPNPPAQPQQQVQVQQPQPDQQPQVPYNTQQQTAQQVQQPQTEEVPGPPQPKPIQQQQGFSAQQGVPNSQQGPAFGCQDGPIQQAVFQQPNQPCYGVPNQQFGPTPAPAAATTAFTYPTFPPHTFPSHTFPTLPPHTFPPHSFPPHSFPPHSFPTLPPHTFPPHTIPPFTFPPGAVTLPPHTLPPGGFPTLPPHTFPPGGFPTLPPHTFPPGGFPTLPPHTFPPGGFPTLPPHTFPPGGFPTLPPHTFPPFPAISGLGVTPAPSFGGAAQAFGVPSVSAGSAAGGTGGAAAFGAPSVSGSASLGPIPPVPGASPPLSTFERELAIQSSIPGVPTNAAGTPFDLFGPALSLLMPGGTLPTLAPLAPVAPTDPPPPQPLPIAQASGSQAQAQANNAGAPVNMDLPQLNPTPDLTTLEQQLRSSGGMGPAQTAGGPAINAAPTYQGQNGPIPNDCNNPTTTAPSSECNNNIVLPDHQGQAAVPTNEEYQQQQGYQQQQQQSYPQQQQAQPQQNQVPYYTNNGKK